jgi:hypothetical protein
MHFFCIKGGGFPLRNRYGSPWAFAKARAQPIAVCFLDNAGFAIHDLQRSFHAFRDTGAAAVAERLIYVNDFTLQFFVPLCGSYRWWGKPVWWVLNRGKIGASVWVLAV